MSRGAVILILFLSTFLVAALGATYYFYGKYTAIERTIEARQKDEVQYLLEMVGRHIVLPNEQPILATVTDPEILRSQPFFINAKEGDKVLIFASAKKAILYDPESDRLVEVAPFSVEDLRTGENGTQLESGETAVSTSTAAN